jgi:NTE family protein
MTVAFVLSGGASLGAVQVGMLQALLRWGARPDFVLGTSVGAVNGAWLAGHPDAAGADRLASIWRGLRRADVFPSSPLRALTAAAGRSRAVVSPHGLRGLLAEQIPFQRLENAPVPLHVVVADVLTGEDVLLSDGPAVEAVMASAAIPGLYPPAQAGGRCYMDGGTVNNTPISHAVALGADVVWVLPTGYSCALRSAPASALGMALHGLTLLINQRLAADYCRYRDQVDLRVAPPLCPLDVSPGDFSHAAALIDRARLSTSAWLGSGSYRDAAWPRYPHGHPADAPRTGLSSG